MAPVGEPRRSWFPRTVTEPASYLSIPKIARATSLRPEPTSPASATISPARTVKEMSVNTPSRVSRSTVSSGSPGVPCSSAGRSASSRPTMALTRSPAPRPASSRVSTCLPSRITVTRWQRAKTSSSRCEMNRTAVPAAHSVRTTSKSLSTSAADSDPGGPRHRRAVQRDLAAVGQQRPCVRLVHPGQDLHQRRLARPVLPDQGVSLSGIQLDRPVGQRLHRTERLRGMLQHQDQLGGSASGPGVPAGLAARSHLHPAPACREWNVSICTSSVTSASQRVNDPPVARRRIVIGWPASTIGGPRRVEPACEGLGSEG
jgi:hypothetical protein